MTNSRLNNHLQEPLNLDTSLFDKKNKLMGQAVGLETEKDSEIVKDYLIKGNFSFKELVDIFDVLTERILNSLSQKHKEQKGQIFLKLKFLATRFRSSFSDLFSDSKTPEKSLYIPLLNKNENLLLRKTNGRIRYWYFNREHLGSDTKENRKEIEKRFGIDLEFIASKLPPPLEK